MAKNRKAANQASLFDLFEQTPDLGTTLLLPVPVEPWVPVDRVDFAPSGQTAKVEANLAALRTLRTLTGGASPAERAVLARWSGWGAIPGMFDEDDTRWAGARTELSRLLDPAAWDAAARTTINAHYTPAEIVDAIWDAVIGLGFKGGRVLEPGCGSGNFIGLAPLPVDATGIELDPTTAAIAAALYPSAMIRAESFADTRLPNGHFDLTVGNVPFGKIVLHDPIHNQGRLSMHNHFIVKSLQLTRPGGIVAVITSRFTMDARNPSARREIASLADLIGAVRLPAGTMRATAGTDVIVDLLLLRRGAGGGEPWATVQPVDTDDGPVTVNEYLARHRNLILGTLGAAGGQYGETDITVKATGPVGPMLTEALSELVDHAHAAGLAGTHRPAVCRPEPVQADLGGVTFGEYHHEGSIVATRGGFARQVGGIAEPFDVKPRSDAPELAALIAIRDTLAATLAAQASSLDDTDFAAAQADLNAAYDTYSRRFGPLNRFKMARTGRTDPDTGEDKQRRMMPRMGGFRSDPDWPSVSALEHFDPEYQTATKAAIFTQRVVTLRQPRMGADTAQDALAICLDTYGRVDLDRVAGLLGVDLGDARTELGALVFDDPATPGRLIPAAAYLSGNVRTKLAEAVTAGYESNIAALRAVQPVDLTPEDIDARLGAPWIDAADIEDFARETLGAQYVKVEYTAAASLWAITCNGWERHTTRMSSTWGTRRADAITLIGRSLEQQPVTIYDYLDDRTRVVNPTDTLAAREKQDALERRFSEWVWESPARADRLAERYNRLFNSTVAATYDGSHLTTPGLASNFHPHPHQLDAVWRILSDPTVLLGHAVGAGKTAVMVIAGMEMRRLGLARRPIYTVPNHMLEQFSREFIQLYPRAKVLVANKDDVGKTNRKTFAARCATGDWDAVVISHTSFERLGVSPETQARFLADQIGEYDAAIRASKIGEKLNAKRLETAKARLEEKHKTLINAERRDDGVTWETMGVDYIFCDEAHAHKNLGFPSHVQGLGGTGSQRAEDMALKLHTLRDRHGARVATFATATPITNTIGEMYVMQRYLQPDTLAAAGIASFDAWAATFGRTVTTLELAPDGGSYRINTRFARFANVPELVTMFRLIADIRTTEQLGLPTPAIIGGHPDTVVVDPSDGLLDYVGELVARSEKIRSRQVPPEEDNMLKVSGDGRAAALDLRLVGHRPDPRGGKIMAAATRIAGIWAEHAGQQFTDATGLPDPRPGALQLVFCELGTPRATWNVYRELRDQLVTLGLPADQVRFIHEAADDRAKAELFEACRAGRVAVLVGSTQKMGVGTNVQRRAVALHHLDAPWRPADIEQREGRILRQGNHHSAVHIVRYVTERSFDVFMWQTLQRKAGFIHQVTQGEVPGRQVDDVGDQELSYAEVKALATGNPLIMEKAGVEGELAKLERLARAHQTEQRSLALRQRDNADRAVRLSARAAACDRAAARRVDTRGDLFTMTVAGTVHTARVDAGVHLRHTLIDMIDTFDGRERGTAIGTIAGFTVQVDIAGFPLIDATIALVGVPVQPLRLSRGDLKAADPAGLIARLENRAARLEEAAAACRDEIDVCDSEGEEIADRLGRTFEHADRLTRLRARLIELDELLAPTPDRGALTAA